ncbi:MAG: Photosystem I assembly protein Ycf3 [Candidatus Methanoperedenaceae archaeon GB50]|nr:MAG: Photosystem I assembly protein Ycf3 [Candidatus Methanoperedenaceae archaeon GB50]
MQSKDMCIKEMRQTISLDPNHAEALNYLGYTYAEMGENLEEAERLIKRALEIKPEDGYIIDSLGWVYYQRGEYKKALEILKKAHKLASKDPIITEHLGDVYSKNGLYQEALKYYRQALKLKPDNPENISFKD